MYFIDNYFKDFEEYPDIQGELLPHGTLYSYISSTFVNGFLNYSKPQKAFLMHRYADTYNESVKSVDEFNASDSFHTDLNLTDDILLLSFNPKGAEYWFFWLDLDVSDCKIGRFKTSDSMVTVLNSFELYVLQTQQNLKYVDHDEVPLELNIKKFTGGMKF